MLHPLHRTALQLAPTQMDLVPQSTFQSAVAELLVVQQEHEQEQRTRQQLSTVRVGVDAWMRERVGVLRVEQVQMSACACGRALCISRAGGRFSTHPAHGHGAGRVSVDWSGCLLPALSRRAVDDGAPLDVCDGSLGADVRIVTARLLLACCAQASVTDDRARTRLGSVHRVVQHLAKAHPPIFVNM
jgi:hypothetical protein